MKTPFGPWSTAIHPGNNPQLSTFWKKRMAMLAPLSRQRFRVSRWAMLCLLALGGLLGVIPTLTPAPAVAQKKVAKEKETPKQKESNSQWGHLVGRFIYDGEPPEQKPVPINVYKEIFERYHLVDESLLVNQKHGIKNVMIYVATGDVEVHESYVQSSPSKVLLKIEKGQFQPRVVPLWIGQQRLTIENTEPVFSNVHSYPVKNTPFNVVLASNSRIAPKVDLQEKYPVPTSSDVHPWMRSFILPRSNPYVAVSNVDGRFQLKNLPVGKLKFIVWHEKAGKLLPNFEGPKKFTAVTRKEFTLDIKPGRNNLGTLNINSADFKG